MLPPASAVHQSCSSLFQSTASALHTTRSKRPDRSRDGIEIRYGVVRKVQERLSNNGSLLGFIAVHPDFGSVDVLAERAVQVEFDIDIGWEVELAVERTSAVTGENGSRSAKLPDVGRAGRGSVEAGLDAIASGLDLREHEVDLSHDAGYVETFCVCVDASVD